MILKNFIAQLGAVQVRVHEYWPEGNTTLAFPHYVVAYLSGGERFRVAENRLTLPKTKAKKKASKS